MTNSKPTTTFVNTYNVDQTKSEVKLVIAKKKQRASEVSVTLPAKFFIPRYSIDDNGGGYKGL